MLWCNQSQKTILCSPEHDFKDHLDSLKYTALQLLQPFSLAILFLSSVATRSLDLQMSIQKVLSV